jgi:lipopolysaccharide/colanic/teichoic acid biosynthesis glycosyltransferase
MRKSITNAFELIKLQIVSMKIYNFIGMKIIKFSRFIKSILDKFVAAIALIILSPVLLGVAIAIYIRMGNPILFFVYPITSWQR